MPGKPQIHRAQAVVPRADVHVERALVELDDLVVMRLAEHDRVGLDERVRVLREPAARRDQQIFVLRDRLEQRLVELQRERRGVADELDVVVPRERVAACPWPACRRRC